MFPRVTVSMKQSVQPSISSVMIYGMENLCILYLSQTGERRTFISKQFNIYSKDFFTHMNTQIYKKYVYNNKVISSFNKWSQAAGNDMEAQYEASPPSCCLMTHSLTHLLQYILLFPLLLCSLSLPYTPSPSLPVSSANLSPKAPVIHIKEEPKNAAR